jgi:uncharacterized protein (DUF2249 family)
MLLFARRGTSTGLARLRRDHVRLRRATEVLERAAAAGEGTWSPGWLAAVTRDVVCQLERHLAEEERLLAVGGAPSQQAVAGLRGRPHEWYPLTEGSAIDLDALPPDQLIDAMTDRLLRLDRGEQVELCSGRDPWLVWRQMDDISPGRYGFVYLEDGPDLWRMRVTRRY